MSNPLMAQVRLCFSSVNVSLTHSQRNMVARIYRGGPQSLTEQQSLVSDNRIKTIFGVFKFIFDTEAGIPITLKIFKLFKSFLTFL